MPKDVRFLIITPDDGETEILPEIALKDMKMSDEDIKEIYGNKAYWMCLSIQDSSFADQQAVVRDCTNKDGKYDSTLEPQKRFARAVTQGSWTKQFCSQDNKTVLSVDEDTFLSIKPPLLGNLIDQEILRVWYPGASKSLDFIAEWQKKREESAKGNGSTSSESTPESLPTTAGKATGRHSTPA
jgi:hypothetical protein